MPKEVVQTKVFIPFVKPVTLELLIVLVVTLPPPLTTVQFPKPIVGVFPFKFADDVQIVWSGPALAGVGNGLTYKFIVLEDEAQTPLEIVHTKVFVPVINAVTVETLSVGV